MLSALRNCMKVKELRKRIWFTAGIIILCRFAANIPCPGVDSIALGEYFKELSQSSGDGGVMGMVNMFSGGALQNFAIATLGIMPYISASIIMQLITPVIPSLEKLQREGDVGRQKINQYTRYLTLLICIVQGAVAAMGMIDPSRLGLQSPTTPLVSGDATMFVVMTTIILTCGTMIYMWLGEQITEKGIGNGISLIITVNIIARMPDAAVSLYELVTNEATLSGQSFRSVHLLILILVFAAITALTIALTQGQRRIPIQMARRTAGNQMQGGTTYMPLKVNFAGVMPIIFAGAILMLPGMVFSLEFEWIRELNLARFFAYGTGWYMFFYGLMIVLFTYFWVANQFNPVQIADNLKREGAYIPGIRPGEPTSSFLDHTMTKITFFGAIFLTFLAIAPMFLYSTYDLPNVLTQFMGGTSLLIMVGVVLDTLSQMESHLVMQNYEGFLKKGSLQGR